MPTTSPFARKTSFYAVKTVSAARRGGLLAESSESSLLTFLKG
ncbi:hypothetical protein [Novipirellula rosea]